MKKLILFAMIFVFASYVSAYCCINPLANTDICIDMNFSEKVMEELCCQQNNLFGKSDNYPGSREDCIENFILDDCDKEKCNPGCCFDLQTNTCFSNVPEFSCNGVYTQKLNGSCEKEGYFAFPVCEVGCCCEEYRFSMTTERACEGDFKKGISSQKICGFFCNSKLCTEGCQIEKPFFCENDRIKVDCTGGDGIVGNGNDCGCPPGEMCESSGKCIRPKPLSSYETIGSCNNEGYLWCETEQICVSSCYRCASSKEKGNLCIDSCTDVECGENSHCIEGECICEEGYYDEICKAFGANIDSERDGCFRNSPCEDRNSSPSFWIFGVVLLVILGIIFLKRKSRKKPPEKQVPYWQQYPPQGFQRPPY